MAHYAFLDENNIVTEVITGHDENDDTDWEKYYGDMRNQTCLRTSYNTHNGEHANGGEPFRGNYAGIGYSYDEQLDAFIPPQPYASWLLDTAYFYWYPPVPYPNDGERYFWDEDSKTWMPKEIF